MKRVLMIVLLLIGSMVVLTGCQVQSDSTGMAGLFYDYFVGPFAQLIRGVAQLFNGNYGLSIILITIAIRLILMPLTLKQYKGQQSMKDKMELMKPEMESIQKKLKETKDPEKQKELQQEMMGLYKKHGVNPLSMGCLPAFIQMPILMGFYYAIYGSEEIASHTFLWFNLGQADIPLALLAGIIYYFQFKVSQATMPEAQQKQMKIVGLLSPAMILIFSFTAPAALPLYWVVGGIFLIGQTILAQKLYSKTPDKPNSTNQATE